MHMHKNKFGTRVKFLGFAPPRLICNCEEATCTPYHALVTRRRWTTDTELQAEKHEGSVTNRSVSESSDRRLQRQTRFPYRFRCEPIEVRRMIRSIKRWPNTAKHTRVMLWKIKHCTRICWGIFHESIPCLCCKSFQNLQRQRDKIPYLLEKSHSLVHGNATDNTLGGLCHTTRMKRTSMCLPSSLYSHQSTPSYFANN